jgi:hypothetical protein
MPPDGQAESSAPETLDDLAAFLVDNPLDEDQPPEKAPAKKPASTDTRTRKDADTPDDDAAPAPDTEEEPEPDPDEEEDEDADKDAEPTSERKHKVTIKGEDGADEVVEVTDSELIKGYMRQADYSRKRNADEAQKTEMAQRTLGALETQRTRHVEQLQAYARSIQQLAGLRSPQEMAQLAQTDPAAWVAEQQRERLINNELQRVGESIQAEKAEAERIAEVTQQAAFQKAWGVLGQQGIDKPKLRKIYDDTKTHYGFTEEQLARVSDPALVLMMKDATAYRALKAKTAEVTQKAKDAPRLPPPRQPVPRNEQLAKRIDARFKGGKARLDDLAAYIAINKL